MPDRTVSSIGVVLHLAGVLLQVLLLVVDAVHDEVAAAPAQERAAEAERGWDPPM